MKGVSLLLSVAALFAFVQDGCLGWDDYFSYLPNIKRPTSDYFSYLGDSPESDYFSYPPERPNSDYFSYLPGRPISDYFSYLRERPKTKSCGRPEGGSKRIIGGSGTSAGQFPWMVSLIMVSARVNFCGAALVTCRHALSAAQCFRKDEKSCKGPKQCLAVIGGYDLSREQYESSKIRWVDRVVTHDGFEMMGLKNDIAVVRFDKRVTFGPTVAPICLAPPGANYEGETAIATGWGATGADDWESDKLLQVSLPILSREACRRGTRELAGKVCAGYFDRRKGICWGDTGGPLMVQGRGGEWVLAGIASTYHKAVARKFQVCSYRVPDLFTDVGHFHDWILPRIRGGCEGV